MSTRAERSRAAAARGRASRIAAAEEKRRRYGQLLRGGYTPQQAAWELGVTYRTAMRYGAQLSQEAQRAA